MKKPLIFLLILALLALIGCGSQVQPSEAATTGVGPQEPDPSLNTKVPAVPPTVAVVETIPLVTSTPPSHPTLAVTASPVAGAAGLALELEKARQDLAVRLTVPLEEINLVEASAVVWPDSALGCPQPDMMYAQMLTRGFRITLEAVGTRYEYHAGADKVFTYCQKPSPALQGGTE